MTETSLKVASYIVLMSQFSSIDWISGAVTSNEIVHFYDLGGLNLDVRKQYISMKINKALSCLIILV